MPFIDLKEQYRRIKPDVDTKIQKVLDHGQFIMGPEVKELEDVLAEYTGSEHCIGVADGTTALLIALMALDVKPGDEVITTPFTFIATGEMISLLGATPVFVDICKDTYNLNPDLLNDAITAKTKVILAVSLYGQCADLNKIGEIAARHKIAVVEDGAQSFGATLGGRKSCSMSTISTTSFFPSKPLGCYGDGGACFTNDVELAERMRQIRVHGQSQRYVHTSLGLNGRLDTLQAAILLAKMAVFPDEVQSRAELGARYSAMFNDAGCRHIKTPVVREDATSVFAQYTIRVPNREKVRELLTDAGIPTAVHYPVCLHQQPVYQDLPMRVTRLTTAEAASKEVMSLPMYPGLTTDIQKSVVDAVVKSVLEAN
ncbi:MAG: DegT/DnrJ/EryC1/StrS family aminotransferase [Burkholderiaceae bacterium]